MSRLAVLGCNTYARMFKCTLWYLAVRSKPLVWYALGRLAFPLWLLCFYPAETRPHAAASHAKRMLDTIRIPPGMFCVPGTVWVSYL